MKTAIKAWLDANVWDGEDRSDCESDYVQFSPNILQELVEECMSDLEPEWVSVDDWMPTSDQNGSQYWVVARLLGTTVTVMATFSDGKWWQDFLCEVKLFDVWPITHYQKVIEPKPPTEKGSK